MEILETLQNEFADFFSIKGIVDLIRSGDYDSLRTWKGITTVLSPLIPFIVMIEILLAFAHKNFNRAEYKIPFFIYVFNRIIGKFISFGIVAYCVGLFSPYALVPVSLTWYWFIYGYIVWEFAHFIYHYLAHKVRLFWCLHSSHHAPEQMNLSVTYAHFFLEGPYADFIRTSICMLAGVPPVMLFAIMFIDGTWGGFIHVGENFMKNARFGFLGKFILTPSHHRVHHARNALYMDTNFCNLLNIWDRVFKTYQPEQDNIKIQYGITRNINAGNFFDVYFGEFYYLVKDVIRAPGIKNKFLYLIMPPGWDHTGNHKLAKDIRQQYIKEHTGQPLVDPVSDDQLNPEHPATSSPGSIV
ncbi:sterol desaturase family protein [Chryseolinea sp. H1M3-3]|uniref:sterol desaturase family protein n=1 Tax=Chryseolinea sp. H1M3-3 TaxID=3034144 RepID=UPI0023EBD6B5|nr:sterol desaturase family protein [Chryseolinea sp. H1M3-3]